jgi:5-methylcytosine-specific restriction endonuclease McrA
MVTPTCRKCKQAIPGEDVNVANDVAYCRACNLKFGSMLTEERRKFVASALRRALPV